MDAPLRHHTPVYRTADIRRIEALAASTTPPLMERAGLAAAHLARSLGSDARRKILVLAGPGNNGGDAFVVARHLRQWWFDVTLVFTGEAARLPPDAREAHAAWRAAGGECAAAIPPRGDWGLAIDGLFGVGLRRAVAGDDARQLAALAACGAPILALDIPSGLDADTGRALGPAVRATHTVTFIGLKPGLLTLDGPDCCGTVHLADLGLDPAALVTPTGRLLGAGIREVLPAGRALNTHKGTYGAAGIIGGASGMVGAALLAGRAALRLGAGRVYVGQLATDAPLVDPVQPELMLRPAADMAALAPTAWAIGPGLSQSAAAYDHLAALLPCPAPLVLDADALNLIGADPGLQRLVHARTAATLLTPHPAEAARLLGATTAAVQSDRLAAAEALAARYRAHVVVKGVGSVCATPAGAWHVNTSGNPGMASAGMGDVLTGILAALLAQGIAPDTALLAGVWLHGAAADAAVAAGAGPAGLTAGEVIDAARALFNRR